MNNPMNTFMKFNYLQKELPAPASFQSRTQDLHLPYRLDQNQRLILPDTLHLRLIQPAQPDKTKEELEVLLKKIDQRVKEGKVLTVDRIKYIPKIQIREKIKIVPEVRYVYMPLGYEISQEEPVAVQKPSSQSDQNLKRLISNILGNSTPDLQNFHKLSQREVEQISSKAIDQINKPKLQMLQGSFKKSMLMSGSFMQKGEEDTQMGSIRGSFIQSGDGNIITYLNKIRALQASLQHQRRQFALENQQLSQKLRIVTAQLNQNSHRLQQLQSSNRSLETDLISIKKQNRQLQNLKAKLQSEAQKKQEDQLQDSEAFSVKDMRKNIFDLNRMLREKDQQIYHLRYFKDKGGIPQIFNLEGHLDQITELRDQILRLYRNNDYLNQQLELKQSKLKQLKKNKFEGDDMSDISVSDSEHSTTPDFQNILKQNNKLKQRNSELLAQVNQLQDSSRLNDEMQRLRMKLAQQVGQTECLQIQLKNRNKILQTLKINSIYVPLLLEALYRDQSDLTLKYLHSHHLDSVLDQLEQGDRQFIRQLIGQTRIRCLLDLDQKTSQARESKAQLQKIKNSILEYCSPEQIRLFESILRAQSVVEREGYFRRGMDLKQIQKLGKEGKLIYMPDHMSKLKLIEFQQQLYQMLRADPLNSQELHKYKQSCAELINSRIDLFSSCENCISKSEDLRRSEEWRRSDESGREQITPLVFKGQNIREEGNSDTERGMQRVKDKLQSYQKLRIDPNKQQQNIFYEPQQSQQLEESKESMRDQTSSKHSKVQEKKNKGRPSTKKYSKLMQKKQRSSEEDMMK